jgi:hypothetical protein
VQALALGGSRIAQARGALQDAHKEGYSQLICRRRVFKITRTNFRVFIF